MLRRVPRVMGRPLCASASAWRDLRGLDWSRPEKEGPKPRRRVPSRSTIPVHTQRDGTGAPTEFSQNQIPDFRWACPISPPTQFLEAPCNAATTFPPHCYYIATTWIAKYDHAPRYCRPGGHRRGSRSHPLDHTPLDRARGLSCYPAPGRHLDDYAKPYRTMATGPMATQ